MGCLLHLLYGRVNQSKLLDCLEGIGLKGRIVEF